MSTPDEKPKTDADLTEDLLVEIRTHLAHLRSWLPLIRSMPETHRDGLGFIPTEMRQVMGRQHAVERRELREAQSSGLPLGRGASEAPGNLSSWALEADVDATLRHLLRYVLRRTPAAHVPVSKAATMGHLERSTGTALDRLSTACRYVTDRHVALAVQRDLDHLVTTCRRALFGEDRMHLGTCPHCRRPTLVVYLQTGVIRCERPRNEDDGRTPRCKCDPEDPASQLAGASQLCPCHSDPKFDHHWLRDRPGSHYLSWPALQTALDHPSMKKRATR